MTQCIELSGGYCATFDDEDAEIVMAYRWGPRHGNSGHTYAVTQRTTGGVRCYFLMHRLILGLTDPSIVVDHRDGNGLNNARSNIRSCSHSENLRNSKTRKHSRSGIRNLRQEMRRGVLVWVARVQANKRRFTRRFRNREDAIQWAAATRKKLHGDFFFEDQKQK